MVSSSSKLMTNTELYLPTEAEARVYAKLYANARFGAVSEEGIPPLSKKTAKIWELTLPDRTSPNELHKSKETKISRLSWLASRPSRLPE